jgi:hypothetical protein
MNTCQFFFDIVILAHGYEQYKFVSVLNKAPQYDKMEGSDGTKLIAACILNTGRR